jgi:VWFA-related protein
MLAIAGVIHAQQPEPASSAVPVTVFATVATAQKEPVADLTAADFQLLQGSQRLAIASITRARVPASLVILLDTSGSMSLQLDRLYFGAARLMSDLTQADRVRVGSFSAGTVLSPAFSSSREALARDLRTYTVLGNPSVVFDAVIAGVSALAPEPGRRVVVMFTDGADDRSRSSYDQAVRLAQSEGVALFAVGVRPVYPPALRIAPRVDGRLKKLAAATGGGFVEVDDEADMASGLKAFVRDISTPYAITFTPAVRDGKLHDLKVVVNRRDVSVTAPSRFLARQ